MTAQTTPTPEAAQPPAALVVAPSTKQQTLMQLLDRAKGSIAAVLPKHLTPERLIKVALSATSRTPALLQCTPQSVLRCVMQAAELGLEAGGLLGEAYLVPFFNNKLNPPALEATLIVGYQGLIKLARQSGQIRSIEARVVRENDAFDFEFGLTPRLAHKPCTNGDPGPVTFAYAIARLKDGGEQVDVMTVAEVEAIRTRSKSGNDGPWGTDYPEMAKKTVVRRLCKYTPRSAELTRALELDAVDAPIQTIDVDILGVDGEPTEPATRTDGLKAKLAEKAGAVA